MATIYVHQVNISESELTVVKLLESRFSTALLQYDGNVWIVPSVDINVGTGRHDIDILVIGHLRRPYIIDRVVNFRDIEVRSFFTTIEVKSHDISGIRQNGSHLEVAYGTQYEDVTIQSQQQKYSLKNFLQENLQCSDIRVPYITNLIILSGASYNDLEYSGISLDNVLASDFMFDNFAQAVSRQTHLQDQGYVDGFRNFSESQIRSVVNIFSAKSDGADTMTLRRINILQLQQGQLNNIENITDPIIVLSGHAGTGKTMMLLQAADRLTQNGYRCLFLTYNTALISDIQHSIQYMPNTQLLNVEFKSMYSFFSSFFYRLGIARSNEEIINNFDIFMTRLSQRLRNNNIANDYDYIFVDEAQDWKRNEVEVLKRICNGIHIVIADGIDQFMRSDLHSDWGDATLPKLRKGLRQRCNLTTFAKVFANKFGVYWDVQANEQLPGGKVIIVEGYDERLHQELLASLKAHDCAAYDLMLLAPPSLKRNGAFALKDTYVQRGIPFFDGINDQNRNRIYGRENADRKECRIYQYESCRGLEAWITVCLRFHELFSEPHPHDYNDISYEAARKYMLALWTLIPLTRAVDTLVLVVRHDSAIARVLLEISQELDFVEYRRNN